MNILRALRSIRAHSVDKYLLDNYMRFTNMTYYDVVCSNRVFKITRDKFHPIPRLFLIINLYWSGVSISWRVD